MAGIVQADRHIDFFHAELHRRMLELLLGALASTLLAALFARGRVRPFRRLVHATEQIAAGKFNEEIVIDRSDEAGELAASFNRMARQLKAAKEVVAMQQSYAKVSGVFETLPAERLVEDAIAMNAGSFDHHGIVLKRNFAAAPPVLVDRRKVLQILINLIRNAKNALDGAGRIDKRIAISIAPSGDDRVCIGVTDNGTGISPENLTRIFGHGFTTKKDGHGFGLHGGANAVREIGGELSVQRAGLGKGATFTLELPTARAAAHA